MVELITGILIAGVVYWAVQELIFPHVAEPFRNVVRVLIIVAVVVYAVRALAALL